MNTKTKRKREKKQDDEGQEERRAKEQLQIKKGYYPEGSIMMCFCVLFCQAGVFDTHTHTLTHAHTLRDNSVCSAGRNKGL